jgi:NAD(P)-dependent dehydrogenase (short-subunit alcohol dehydrogenase family)
MRSLSDLMRLDGRVALVTGGAGHIGGAMAEALLELGATVVIADLDATACRRRAEELQPNRGSQVDSLAIDLLDEAATREAVRTTVARHHGLDVLVHCAAFVGSMQLPGWAEPLERQTVEAWDAAMRVNTTAAFVLTQEAGPALARSGHGSVVFVSSIYGLVGPDMGLYEGTAMQHPAAYGVSKAGLLQLVRFFATTLAPAVRVNAIVPGGVWRAQPEAFHTRYKARTPLQRMAVEEDFKGATAFLASDLSAYVTGQAVVVDGGWTAW